MTTSPCPVSSTHVRDSNDRAFAADVLKASDKQPVLVDFWAPWCGPCRALTPILERTVASQSGKVKLVKINIDKNPAIAGQLGVRSIPAVFAFNKGQPVDHFQGALPESGIRQFIDRVLESTDPGKQLAQKLKRAKEAIQGGDTATAAQIYGELIATDPGNTDAIAGLARCYLVNGDSHRARQILAMAPADKQSDPALGSVQASLDLMTVPVRNDDTQDRARKALLRDRNDHATRYSFAETLAAKGQYKDAADHLLIILASDMDWENGKAKTQLLRIFEAAGSEDPVTREGRRQLGSLMFS